ncbi:unnamed protein product [Chilo suppressalis]|uniref:Major facilitator superfamily (MFS) profile domain-containing protein n=1 Tax=Chilo suppressalis TaxID=168631 RepID=A0ABN8BAF9_CHISP|nr:unnamed protein product [Chilo suppressalis]
MVYKISVTGTAVAEEVEKPSVWKEVVLSFIASLPFLTHGIEATELYATSHSGNFIDSPEKVPWNATALILAAAVTAPILCYISDKFGRKVGIFIVSLTQGISCIPLFLPPNFITTLILHVVAGISTGGLFTILPIYICEINSIKNRGLCLSFMMVMTTLAYVMKLVIDLETMMYLMAAVVMIQLLSMLCLIESPSYCVMAGKMEIAKAKMSKLKCLENDNPNLTKELEILRDESYRAKSHGKLTLAHILRNLIWRDATKIGVLLHTTMVLCGSIVFLDQDKTLMQLRIPSDPDRMLVLVGMFVGSLVTFLLILFVERKYILTFGYITMVLSMGVLAIYTQIDLTVTSLRWVPVAALAILVFGYGVAWGFPTIIVVEIYNLEIRATMVGTLFTYSQIIKLIHIHTYQYIEDYMGIFVLFYIFAAINIYAGVYGLFTIPNLKDKTVKQIEKQLKRIPLIKL